MRGIRIAGWIPCPQRMASIDVNAAMGRVGLPAPAAELAKRDWDVIVVGGGHNGLTVLCGAATRPGGSVIALNGRIAALGVLDLTEPG